MLFIPRSFAHGFLTLEDNTEIFYKCDNFYNPKSEIGIIWNDRDLNINWNFKKYNIDENELIISEKDKNNISFKEYKKINSIEQERRMKLIFGANGKLGTDFKELFDSTGEKYIATDKNEVDIHPQ